MNVRRIWSAVILTDQAILSETFQMHATEMLIVRVLLEWRSAYGSEFATCRETALQATS